MTYIRVDGDVIRVTGHEGVKIPPTKRQYCCQSSDQRIRDMIRGMEYRERLVVLDEIGNIYRDGKESANV